MTMRLAPDLKERIDQWAKRNGENSRSEAMRLLLEAGLAAQRKKAAAK
jgi:metal-responsive CopG/Arc/MetJ family transcriptional regulator